MTSSALAEEMISSEQFGNEFPSMIKLMAISRVLPVSSVECERGFFKQNFIKTPLRYSLSIDMHDKLMRVSINVPKLPAFNPIAYISQIVKFISPGPFEISKLTEPCYMVIFVSLIVCKI